MFDILAITLHDFRSFGGQHHFEFPTKSGLYSLTGKNLDNPRLGSNGAGKSTMLEAIHWCLYGKTSRGLKAGDIVTWGEKSAAVHLELVVAQQRLTIYRRQNPNQLALNGRVVDQATLEQTLRLNAEQFCYSVMLPQFGEAFFDLAPAAKLTLFSAIMDLDFWLERSKAAAARASEVASLKASHEMLIARYQGQIEGTERDLALLEPQMRAFVAEQADAIKEIYQKLSALTPQKQALEKSIKERKTILAKLNKDAINLETEIDQCHQAFVKRGVLEKEIARLGSLRGYCPTCGQKVAADKVHAELKAAKDELAEVANAEADFADLKAAQGSVNKDIRGEERELLREENQVMLILRQQKELSAQHEIERARENPYGKLIQEKRKALNGLSDKLKIEQELLRQATVKHDATEFWVAGFKRLRLSVLDEALAQLELEVNNNLVSLGLTDWKVVFDVERETKSGGISKGFSVFVYQPGQEQPIRWEAFCGGETQRVRLAGNLGLANLIMERAGLRSQVEFLDEPSAHLSQEGVEDLVDTLYERAHETGRKIWIIDHRSIDFPFDGTLTVTKDANGSHLG